MQAVESGADKREYAIKTAVRNNKENANVAALARDKRL